MDNKSDKLNALDLGQLLVDHKAGNTVVLNIAEQSSWTDYFVIATVNSIGHLRGLVRQVSAYLEEKGIHIKHRHKRIAEDGWELIDCGYMVIHLMNKEKRDFYNLEKLWHSGECLFEDKEQR